MKKLKFALWAIAMALCGVPVFAQESQTDFDLTELGTAATTISTNFKTVMTGPVWTAAKVVLGILVLYFLLFKLPRMFGLGKK